MYPRWHIILGGIFSLVWKIVFPDTAWIYIAIIFLASFLIDFDHYVVAVLKTGKIGLRDAFKYCLLKGKQGKEERRRGIRRKGDFHIFHTIEFHIFILILGLWWRPFLYVFIGMAFHSIVDFISLVKEDWLFRREYFLLNWLIRKIKLHPKKV